MTTTRREKLKANLLNHYTEKEPKAFLQFDAFRVDDLYGGVTHELMRGSGVRILIDPETPKEDALEMIKALRKFIKQAYDSQLKELARENQELDAPRCDSCGQELSIFDTWSQEKEP